MNPAAAVFDQIGLLKWSHLTNYTLEVLRYLPRGERIKHTCRSPSNCRVSFGVSLVISIIIRYMLNNFHLSSSLAVVVEPRDWRFPILKCAQLVSNTAMYWQKI